MTAILKFICVIAAHYGVHEKRWELKRRLLHFVAWWTKTPEGNRIPDGLWPEWGEGEVQRCPGCSVVFMRAMDERPSPRCRRCDADHENPDVWTKPDERYGGIVCYPMAMQNRPVIWEDDLDAGPIDEDALERAYDRMCKLFDIRTETMPNGATFSVMRRKGESEVVGVASGFSVPREVTDPRSHGFTARSDDRETCFHCARPKDEHVPKEAP